MATFSIPLTADGSVTAPSGTLAVVVPTAESTTYLDIGPVNTLEVPEFGWFLADGVNPLRLVTRGTVYDCGGIAPNTTPTLAETGAVRATVVGTHHAANQPADGTYITIGRPSYSTTVTFKTTLVTDGTLGHQVLIGANVDTTFDNLQKLIQGTGTQGVEYFNVLTYLGFTDSFQTNYFIEVSARDTGANTITLRYTQYGTVGNSSVSTDTVGADFSFASATFTGGSEGTGTAPGPGTYRYFFTWYRDADGAETGRSEIASITKTANNNIAVSNLSASADTTFDYVRIYRTTNSGVEFRLVGAVARADVGSGFTDDVSDDTLAESSEWNQLLHRDYTEGMPPRGRALAYWKGSVWTLGAHLHAEYTRGTVDVTPDSAAITFSVKGVTSWMQGRIFQVNSTSEEYTLISVSESGPTAVLDRPYEGANNDTASFTIRDAYDACRIRRSVPFLYNQWPVDESPGRVDTDDPEGGTALLATESRLFAFSKTSIVAVTGDGPESWEISKVAQGVGCVAPRMVVAVEGGGMFLDHKGIYGLSPDETVVCLSTPKSPKGTTAQGLDGTIARIEWANIDQGYSFYDQVDRVVVFGVPLDGAVVPNYEIVFDLQNGAWSLYKRPEFTCVGEATLPDGSLALLAGDRDGNVWQVGVGASDGFYGTEAVQTLSGAQTVRALTVGSAVFTTTGDAEKGKPVIVLYADGSTIAYGKVASNTSTILTLAEDLATAPAASDQIVLGGIHWQVRSGFATVGEEYDQKTLRSVTVRHAPTTRGRYFFSFAVDGGSFGLASEGTSIGSLSETDGKVRHVVQYPGDSHALQLQGFQPGGQAVIRGGVLDFFVREKGRM